MKIAIMSDVHLEFGSMQVANVDGCDVLVLAGDVLVARTLQQTTAEPHTVAYKDRLRYIEFVERCVQEFKHVVAIAGNHEFYGGKFVQTVSTLRHFYKQHGVYFLENDCVELEGRKFCGCTLWTNFNDDPVAMQQARWGINDFKKIVDDTGLNYTHLSPQRVLNRHLDSSAWLYDVTTPGSVVVTHMAPSNQSVAAHFQGDPLNTYYYVDMSELMYQRSPQLWIHGHMHDASDYQLYNTRVVCNPRGYAGYENTAGYTYKVVEL